MKQFRNTLSLFILFIYVSFSFTIDSEVQEVKTQEFVVIDSVLIDDCIFDTKTQNEEFLKGIEELSGWNWIDGLHTAFIPLENGDTIEINKGGCIHYNYYVRLHSYSDSTSVRQTNYWKNEILKITRFYLILRRIWRIH
ncbi:MAG: hypothetical protein JKY53_02540 [Flavobacteriales bacterium]|nr:hypothetical protein [Flavobacteriales bacterium]